MSTKNDYTQCSTCHHYCPDPNHESGSCWMLLYGCSKIPEVATWTKADTATSFRANVHPTFGCKLWRKR